MSISVVIPTYNGADHLKDNLPYLIDILQDYKNEDIEVVLTDDHSTDDTIEVLKKTKESSNIPVTILESEKNGGFSVNVNKGVRKAKGEIVILLGGDVRPERDFLKPLTSHFTDEKVFAVGFLNQSDQDKGKNILRGRGIGTWKKGFLLHSHGEPVNDDTLWVDCGSGAFRKEIWDRIGGLQELYAPFYWEDVDISYRAQKMGYKVKIERKSLVVHEHEKGSIKKINKNFVLETAYRNQFFFVWLNITDRNLLFQHIIFLPYHLLVAIKTGNLLFIKGFLKALGKLGKALSIRRKTTKDFVISDNSILERFKKEI